MVAKRKVGQESPNKCSKVQKRGEATTQFAARKIRETLKDMTTEEIDVVTVDGKTLRQLMEHHITQLKAGTNVGLEPHRKQSVCEVEEHV